MLARVTDAAGCSWLANSAAVAPLQVTTAGSSFDTLLAAYRYMTPAVESAVRVKSNDDCVPGSGSKHSCVTFYALPSTQYRLQVAGKGGAGGDVAVRISAPVKAKCAAPTAACKKAISCCSRKCVAVGAVGKQCL